MISKIKNLNRVMIFITYCLREQFSINIKIVGLISFDVTMYAYVSLCKDGKI